MTMTEEFRGDFAKANVAQIQYVDIAQGELLIFPLKVILDAPPHVCPKLVHLSERKNAVLFDELIAQFLLRPRRDCVAASLCGPVRSLHTAKALQ